MNRRAFLRRSIALAVGAAVTPTIDIARARPTSGTITGRFAQSEIRSYCEADVSHVKDCYAMLVQHLSKQAEQQFTRLATQDFAELEKRVIAADYRAKLPAFRFAGNLYDDYSEIGNYERLQKGVSTARE